MSLGPILDLGIGLIFVYLLLGLISSAAQELFAGIFSWRSKMLEAAIAKMLSNDQKTNAFFNSVFKHPIIRTITADGRPSYIPSPKFCTALIDVLTPAAAARTFADVEAAIDALPSGLARGSLSALAKDAAGSVNTFRKSVESWYDDAMDRLGGAYKRRTQAFSVIFGLVIAIALNVDSIRLAETLWGNESLRNELASTAQAYSASAENPDASATTGEQDSAQAARERMNREVAALDALRLPVGWDVKGIIAQLDPKAMQQLPHDAVNTDQVAYLFDVIELYFWTLGFGGSLLVFFGWLITAVAVSFGAPFWFDLLKNVTNVRSVGPTPPRADQTEEKTATAT